MGAVMAAFSVASVLGVPAGLWLSQVGGWRLPFFGVSGLGLLVTGAALFVMPAMTKHLEATQAHATTARELLARPTVLYALASVLTMMIGLFLVIPNFSSFLQHNLHYPRENLGQLYMMGGAVSFAMNRLVGGLVDRFGPTLSLIHI